MANIPESLQKGYWELLNELISYVPSDIDTSEGSIVRDLLSPIAIELTNIYVELQEILKRAFVDTSYDEWMDLKAKEFGLERKPASKAVGSVTFTGQAGTIIPAGTIVSTQSDAVSEAITFETTREAMIGADGTVTVSIQAVEEGTKGNVGANTITLLETYIAGVESVTNENPTTGGADIEDDDSLRQRILEKIREYLTGGSIGDYKKWAKDVEGVGDVAVAPCKYGAGTVSIAVLDANLEPATDELLKRVEEYIAEFYEYIFEAENFLTDGYGITAEDLEDDSYTSIKMVYSASGSGKISKSFILDDNGIWCARVRVKVDNNTNNDELLRISVRDEGTNVPCKQSYFTDDNAEIILSASDLQTSFNFVDLDFVYSGNPVRIEIERLTSDTSTTVYIDYVLVKSTFAKDTENCKLPVGVRLYVERPNVVLINIYANVMLKSGYTLSDVKARFAQKVEEYLKSIIFKDDNDVQYVRIGYLLLDTEGIKNYSGLLVNGDTLDINIGRQEIAKLGDITLVM